jgi:hypothetical protein
MEHANLHPYRHAGAAASAEGDIDAPTVDDATAALDVQAQSDFKAQSVHRGVHRPSQWPPVGPEVVVGAAGTETQMSERR